MRKTATAWVVVFLILVMVVIAARIVHFVP
jgi:hypothetical protein